jgi:hypothetical protein
MTRGQAGGKLGELTRVSDRVWTKKTGADSDPASKRAWSA